MMPYKSAEPIAFSKGRPYAIIALVIWRRFSTPLAKVFLNSRPFWRKMPVEKTRGKGSRILQIELDLNRIETATRAFSALLGHLSTREATG